MRYISAEGLEKLKRELEERRTKIRKEIAERLEEAKSLGDLTENAEYAAAREAQSFNEGRILELEELVKNSEVIRPAKGKNETVQLGSAVKVELQNKSAKKNNPEEEKVFTIVDSHEANPLQGKISNESPLGQAFLNHYVGDIIEAETPKGKMRYKIVNIE